MTITDKDDKVYHRNGTELARDRREIAHLYLVKRLYQVEIAQALNAREGVPYKLSQQTVSRDLQALQTEWLRASLMDMTEAKAREIARIDRLELEYWGAWDRSQAEALKSRVSQDVAKGTVTQTSEATQRVGDPRFLDGVGWCIDRRIRLLGLDTTPPEMLVNLADLTNEELERVGKGESVMQVLSERRKASAAGGNQS